jgi:hypothetical protein
MNVRGSVIKHLLGVPEWRTLSSMLVSKYQALAVNADVPLVWWHSEEEDQKRGILRYGVADSVSMASILRS